MHRENILVSLGGLIGLALLGSCDRFDGTSGQSRERPDTPEAAERSLLSGSDAAGIYRAMKRTHPEEFRALTLEIADRAKRGESNAQISSAITRFVIEAETRHRKELEQAGPAALAAFRRADIGMVEMLKQADPRSCALYVVTGQFKLPAGYSGPRAPIADYHVAIWAAFGDARAHPIVRKLDAPSKVDWWQIYRAMLANGTDDRTAKLFFNAQRRNQLDPAHQCDAGLSFRRAIETLPPDRIDNFYLGLRNIVSP